MPFFAFPFVVIGIILFIAGIAGFAYYEAKYRSLNYCKYCGEEIPYDVIFCPKCGRAQK
uniref:Zinc-ribbon domain-containing protein n=1 Tax=candidate division WOR-3 bacterium TaxID=2052148 RepID=A0A7C2NY57_UNCW3